MLLSTVCFINYYTDNEPIIIEQKYGNSLDYTIMLFDNEHYDNNELGEGLEYISSIVDKIDVDYKFKYSNGEVSGYDINTRVVANVVINKPNDPTKVLYKKEYVIIDDDFKKHGIKSTELSKNIIIDFDKYNEDVILYNKMYALSNDAHITVDIFTTGKIEYLDMDKKINNKVSMSIPLGEKTFGVKKTGVINDIKTFDIKTGDKTTVDYIYLAVSIICIGIILFILILFLRMIKKRNSKQTKYEKKLNKILKVYDRVIVITKTLINFDDYKNIPVVTFEELMDVKDNLDKPIIFYENKRLSTSYFYILESNNLYIYKMSDEDEI